MSPSYIMQLIDCKIEQFTTNGYYHHITNGPDITPEEIELTGQKCEETIKKCEK